MVDTTASAAPSRAHARVAPSRSSTTAAQIKELILTRNLHPGDALPTENELCDLLGVSRPTVVRLADAGALPSERYGNRRRIRLGDLLAYRDERRDQQYAMLAATSVDVNDEDDIEQVRERLREARREVSARRRSTSRPA